MPRKVKQNKKKINKRASRKVKSFPKQIQNAAYVPKNRLLKFTDFRSYVVVDEGFNGSGAIPPILEIGANNPRQFIHHKQGTWDACSLNNKTVSVPGIQNWVTNLNPTPSSMAPYLNASCLSCQVVVTATPLPSVAPAAGEADKYQDVIKLCVQTNTRNGMFANRNITNQFNSEVVSQTPYTRTANLYYNANGTPRGATIKYNYSFKKMNAARSGTGGPSNFFHADTDPNERDYINIGLLPTHSQKYGLIVAGGTRLPNIRVEIKVSYIVLLSEPNCQITHDVNLGQNLSNIAHVRQFDAAVAATYGTAV